MSLLNPNNNKFKNIQDNHDMSLDNHVTIDPEDMIYLTQIRNIRYSMPWVIISLGMLGNLLILATFLKKRRRSTSNGFCFNALAISDILALIFMLLGSLLTMRVVSNRSATCKVIRYFYHVTLQLSSWCLVLLSVDRLIAVCFIFKYRDWCKKWIAPKILVGFVIFIILINMHLLIFVDAGLYEVTKTNELKRVSTYNNYNVYNSYNSYNSFNSYGSNNLFYATTTRSSVQYRQVYSCYVDPDEYPFYFQYIYSYWDAFHAVMYGIIPFFIILTCNIMIIVKLIQMRNSKIKRKPSMSKSIESLNNKNNNDSTSLDPTIKSFQITVMLLSVAIVFLLFTSPISIYMAFIHDNITQSVRKTKRELVKTVLRYIAYFNNAVNFYLYFLLSSEFRREFFKSMGVIFKVKELTSCTGSTEVQGQNNMVPKEIKINPRTKPIYRNQLEASRNKYSDEAANEALLDNPSRSVVSGVDRFKTNTRRSPLVHYNRDPYQWNTSLSRTNLALNHDLTRLPQSPFINSQPSEV